MIRCRAIQTLFILVLCWFITISSEACRCFHRYYLFSMFYSAQQNQPNIVECNDRIRAEDVPENQIVSLISYPPQDEQHTANHGKVYSNAVGCRLLVGNQDIAHPYSELNDKEKCDREIIEACKALKKQQGSKWPAAKPRPATYIDF